MRLIDADELKKTICGRCELPSEHLCSTEGDVKGCLAEMINNAPTIDAVQVVRCKDCVYHNSKSHNCGHPKMGFGLMNVNENDFCPHGERRTDV